MIRSTFYPPDSIPHALPAGWQQCLGIDFGKKRVGVAIGNCITYTASPCKTVVAEGEDAHLKAIAALAREWDVQALVLGIPFHPDGATHCNTRRAVAFGRQLAQRCKLPVYGVDERYSTTEALALGAKDADATSACIILEQFLQHCHA